MKNRFPRRLDALPRIFEFLEDAAHKLQLDADANADTEAEADADATFALNLAVEELFTNVLKHNPSGQGPIEIEVDLTPRQLLITFTDFDSPPFDPTTVPPTDTHAPLNARKPGGLGLHILSHLVDRIDSEHQGRTNRIRVTLSLVTPP